MTYCKSWRNERGVCCVCGKLSNVKYVDEDTGLMYCVDCMLISQGLKRPDGICFVCKNTIDDTFCNDSVETQEGRVHSECYNYLCEVGNVSGGY